MSSPPDNERPRLGGMALANGLLVHGPTHWAAAVQRDDGEIVVASGAKPRFSVPLIGDLPVVRGILRIGEAMAVLPVMRRAFPEARFAFDSGPARLAIAATFAGGLIARRRLRSPLGQELASAALGLAPAIVALRTSRAAAWHAVEHKSIAAYEAGGPDEVARADRYPKEHARCGSNLIVPMVAASIAANLLVRLVPGLRRYGARGIAAMLAVGSAVELFAFATRNPGHPVARTVHGIGHAIQARVATTEPDSAEMQVGVAAMEEICRVEGVTG
jgi:uncharacterized protein YqhQ